ncbi:type I-F CRISPR-associated protein Csy2 [Pantoea piersonii]|uniref:Type I-F CRISPR-associated protein Csy2 n=1 Tax=Pantoea piersonii TaxID=2364647 RepID=A0AAJ5QI68_9GAMM|nr:type I-F CRISPR-associated protein Csy2 [Pantoea piersonii]WBG90377.1 type I-F CRISPR-associated protein Csy2 [Pantoea piersonii]
MHLIILRRLRIESANAIAGLTWGFPAITHFLGFTHALSRRLEQSHGLSLKGCGVICHNQQVHAYSSGRDYQFALTRNPLTKEAKTAAFNEEGRMHMTVSLLLQCEGTIDGGEQGAAALEQHLFTACQMQRLAGGTIRQLERVQVIGWPEEEATTRRVMRRLLPGFALVDRSSLLAKHFDVLRQNNPDVEMLDAWLDFASLKMRAVTDKNDPQKGDKAQWQYQPKPDGGFLVPLMTGYRAISPLLEAGKVANARDDETPFCFAEAIYGVGEWRSPHRITRLNELIWHYQYQDEHYLCCSGPVASQPTAMTTNDFFDD